MIWDIIITTMNMTILELPENMNLILTQSLPQLQLQQEELQLWGELQPLEDLITPLLQELLII